MDDKAVRRIMGITQEAIRILASRCIFPNKPRSSRQHRYDNTYIFQELDYINKLRNRIAHHEPICFAHPNAVIDTSYVLNQYARMMRLFSWMGVDGPSLVYGLDHVTNVSGKVMCI